MNPPAYTWIRNPESKTAHLAVYNRLLCGLVVANPMDEPLSPGHARRCKLCVAHAPRLGLMLPEPTPPPGPKPKREPVPDMPPSQLVMTNHALDRFRERAQELPDDVVRAWCQDAWERRAMGNSRMKRVPNHMRYRIVKRSFGGEEREYLACRAPDGRPVYLALSRDRTVVQTVLDVWHWNLFVGVKPTPDIRLRERLIQKLRDAE